MRAAQLKSMAPCWYASMHVKHSGVDFVFYTILLLHVVLNKSYNKFLFYQIVKERINNTCTSNSVEI